MSQPSFVAAFMLAIEVIRVSAGKHNEERRICGDFDAIIKFKA
jgi:hypothetical protein